MEPGIKAVMDLLSVGTLFTLSLAFLWAAESESKELWILDSPLGSYSEGMERLHNFLVYCDFSLLFIIFTIVYNHIIKAYNVFSVSALWTFLVYLFATGLEPRFDNDDEVRSSVKVDKIRFATRVTALLSTAILLMFRYYT